MEDTDLDLEEAFEFLPMWNTQERVVVGYICTPKGADHSFRYDLFSLMAALTSIGRSEKSASPPLIATPMHLDNLRRGRNCEHFAKFGLQSNPKVRERLVVELVVDDVTVDPDDLFRAVDCVQTVCRTILLRVPMEFGAFEEIGDIKVYGIGTRLDPEKTPDYFSTLDNFVAQTEALGRHSYILGLDSMPALTFAICAGFGHVNGPAVPRVGAGEVTYPLAIADLYGVARGSAAKLPAAHQRQVVAADFR